MDSANAKHEGHPRLLLMCLAYGNHVEVARFLEDTLQKELHHRLTIVVADNTPGRNATDISWLPPAAEGARLAGRLAIVGDGTNRGYFGGFRFALAYARARWSEFDWTILSNTDLLLESTDWFSALPPSSSDIGVVAPRIISGLTGKNQNPLYRIRPRPQKFLLLSYVFRFAVTTALYTVASLTKGRLNSRQPNVNNSVDDDEFVYAAHGAFLCISKEYFRRGGALECPTFLYCEEIFLAEELRALSLRVLYMPSARVVHDEHSSTSKMPKRTARKYMSSAHLAAYERMTT